MIITKESARYEIRRDQFPAFFKILDTTSPAIEKNRIVFDRRYLPGTYLVVSGGPFRSERSSGAEEHVLLMDSESSQIKLLDFEPDKGALFVPMLRVVAREERSGKAARFDIPRPETEALDDDWVLWRPSKLYVRVSPKTKEEFLSSRTQRLSVQKTIESLRTEKDDEHYLVSNNFRKAQLTQLEWAARFEIDENGLSARPILMDEKGENSDYMESTSYNPSLPGEISGFSVTVQPKGSPDYLVALFRKSGFKSVNARYMVSDIEAISRLVKKYKRAYFFEGYRLSMADEIRSISFSQQTIEPLVSVRLDEGKGLVYLDEQYYLGEQRIDPDLISERISSRQNFVKRGNRIYGLNIRKLSAISKKIQSKRTLPLGRFYELFEISRGLKKPVYQKSFLSFFKKLAVPSKLPRVLPSKDLLVAEYSPKAYQRVGTSWMTYLGSKGLSGILADDMGLGKTYQALLTIASSQEYSSGCNLIVCPKSLVENWRSEILKFLDLSDDAILIHYGGSREKVIRAIECGGKFVITTYDTARNDAEMLRNISFNYMVLDEAQRIKNPSAKTTKALKILNAKHKLALTGTPLENRLSELWSIFDFLMPGYLSTRTEFVRRFEKPILKFGDKEALKELQVLVRPFILRRTVDKVLKLPGINEWKKSCDLFDEQIALYRKLLEDSESIIKKYKEEDEDKPNIALLALLQKLRMLCSHPDLITKTGEDGDRSGKMEMLFQLLEDILGSKENRVLVFLEFLGNRPFIKDWLRRKRIKFVEMFGETTVAQRKQAIEKFNSGDAQVFLLGLKVGGVGLNLTAANYVMIFDRWWNPATESQARARAYRIGQDRRVTVYRFVTRGSVEERLEELHDKKKELFKNVVDEKVFLNRLTKGDIIKLLNPPGEHAQVSR